MEPGDRVILCTAAPSWVYAKTKRHRANDNLVYLAGIVARAQGELRVVLTGDIHHYNRYANRESGRQLITSGGGGAFLHPTHVLPETVEVDWPAEGVEDLALAGRYPEYLTSRGLALRNLLLPLLNLDFAAAIGAVYALLAWVLESRSVSGIKRSEFVSLHESLWQAAVRFMESLSHSPEFAAAVLLLLALLVRFSDCRLMQNKLLLGGAHWLVHLLALIAAYCLAVETNAWVFGVLPGDSLSTPLLLVELVVTGGLVGGFIFGLYLLLSMNYLGRHWTEASSSLRIQDHKNFLRLKIDTAGRLTIYPVKLARVPRWQSWKQVLPPTGPELIEDPVTVD